MATKRTKQAFDKFVENRGKSVSKAMKDAGFSDAYASNPQQLTASKGWKELMDQYFPEELVAEKHAALLNKKEVIARNNNKTGEVETVETGEIDTQAVKAGVELAYKLRGSFAPDKLDAKVTGVSLKEIFKKAKK